MKKLMLAVLFAAMIAGVAWSADVDQATYWKIAAKTSGSYCVFVAVVTDSNAYYNATPDTSEGFSMLPWGTTAQYPDAVTLYGVFTEVGANGAAVGDCVMVSVDVNVANDSKGTATWSPISGTAGASPTPAGRARRTR